MLLVSSESFWDFRSSKMRGFIVVDDKILSTCLPASCSLWMFFNYLHKFRAHVFVLVYTWWKFSAWSMCKFCGNVDLASFTLTNFNTNWCKRLHYHEFISVLTISITSSIHLAYRSFFNLSIRFSDFWWSLPFRTQIDSKEINCAFASSPKTTQRRRSCYVVEAAASKVASKARLHPTETCQNLHRFA